MRARLLSLVLLCPALLGATSAVAAPKHRPAKEAPAAAQQLGKFEDWSAVAREEGGQTVCYAFTYPSASAPAVSGRGRPVLTVTERPSGRDAVAFSAGFAFAPNAEATLQVEQTALTLYTAGRFAFAREGAAAVALLRKGRQASVRAPAPRGVQVADTFSLRGFEPAYAAIVKACPATAAR